MVDTTIKSHGWAAVEERSQSRLYTDLIVIGLEIRYMPIPNDQPAVLCALVSKFSVSYFSNVEQASEGP